MFVDNFNGFAGKTFIYRPHWFFKGIWSVVKMFIPAKTLEKVKFVDKGKEREFAQELDADYLEEKFGGNLPDVIDYWPPQPKRGCPGIDMNYIAKNDTQIFNILGPTGDKVIFQADPDLKGGLNDSKLNNSST